MRKKREPDAYQIRLNKSNRFALLLFFLLGMIYSFAGTNYRTTINLTYDDKNEPVTTFLNDPANMVTITTTMGENDTLFISDGDTLLIDNVVFDMSEFLLPVIIVIEDTDAHPGKGGMIYFMGGKGEMKLPAGSDIFIDPANLDGITTNIGGGANQGDGETNTVDENVKGGNTLITIGEEKISVKEIERLIELGSLSRFLPVDLVFFQARIQDKAVVLTWQTAWEIDNDFFEVEHSKDGLHFTVLARIKGKGTVDFRNNYQYVHHNPLPGLQYYRLRQVDFDGTFAYSPIAAIQSDKAVPLDFTVAPNPAHHQLEILLPQSPEESLKLLLSNSLGQTRTLNFNQLGNTLQVNLPTQLTAGLYWLHLYDGRQKVSRSVVIE